MTVICFDDSGRRVPLVANSICPFNPLPMFGFDFAMIDCPWPWEAYGEGGYAKSPEAQYETMTWEELVALPVGNLLGAGGVVLMWGTWPLASVQTSIMAGTYPVRRLDGAYDLKGWGIPQKSGGAWAKRTESGKLRWGPGYLFRSVCEPWYIGTIGSKHGVRGRSQVNLIETVEAALLDGIAREHSRKPEEMYRAIEAVLPPHARKVDIFSREPRPGWWSWGREADKFAPEAAA